MPPNFIVPPVLVILAVPRWTDAPVAFSAGSMLIIAVATSASSSAYATVTGSSFRSTQNGRPSTAIESPGSRHTAPSSAHESPTTAAARASTSPSVTICAITRHDSLQRVADDDLRFAHRRAREDQRRDVRRDRPVATGRRRGAPDLRTAGDHPACARRRREHACAAARSGGASAARRAETTSSSAAASCQLAHRRGGRTPARPALPAAACPEWAMAPIAADCAGSRSAAASRPPRCEPCDPRSRRGR